MTKLLIPFVITENKNEPSRVGSRRYGIFLFCGMVLFTNCYVSNIKIPLPDFYYQWLEKTKDAYCVKYADRLWFISTIEELEEEIVIDKNALPSWQQLKAYCSLYKEINQLNATCDQDGNEFELSRLNSCITIGDDNGEPLFCDPSNSYSVWCYYPDGGDVQLLCASLETFISEAEVIHD